MIHIFIKECRLIVMQKIKTFHVNENYVILPNIVFLV